MGQADFGKCVLLWTAEKINTLRAKRGDTEVAVRKT